MVFFGFFRGVTPGFLTSGFLASGRVLRAGFLVRSAPKDGETVTATNITASTTIDIVFSFSYMVLSPFSSYRLRILGDPPIGFFLLFLVSFLQP